MYKMIIVDDEDIVINGLTTVINWKEHQIEIVGTATNGQKALKIIQEQKPDIILTDICMPGMDGLQLIKKVKEEQPNTVFIIISGYAEFEYAKSAIELDVIDYLIKPVDIEEIIGVIKKSIKKNETLQQDQRKQEQIKRYQRELIEKYFLDLLLGLKMADKAIDHDFNQFTVFCFLAI